MKKVIIIEGMMCQNCVKHVKKALEKLEGVSSVKVSLEDKSAEVEGAAEDEALREAIAEAGYEAAEIR
ncbi:heavy-metal-associated domain-containing protein [bacterium]|nr:heavy-metal-associated domain-containing protein [bacterium]